MGVIGRVESLWRYPVKSMRGEELEEVFVGFAGVYGDRLYAFRSSAARVAFPFYTAREQEQMLLYRASYRRPERMTQPPNLVEAQNLGPGVTPVYAEADETMVDVQPPAGEPLGIDDPRLINQLLEGRREAHELTLMRSDRALTDCRPVSLITTSTVRQLGEKLGAGLDKRRFRANIYADLDSGVGFGENEFVGKNLKIGAQVVVAVTDRDPRCKMITLDPDTGEANPDVMRVVARGHDGKVGVYGAVVVEGMVRRGDEIALHE